MIGMLLAAVLVPAPAAAADGWILPGEVWARPRTGERVLGLAPVQAAVAALDRGPDRLLVIRYPGGEEGRLWAEELRDWLAALGVPGRQVELAPGTAQEGALVLDVEGRR